MRNFQSRILTSGQPTETAKILTGSHLEIGEMYIQEIPRHIILSH